MLPPAFLRFLTVIDPRADRPVHRQLADLLRARIAAGQLRPGDRLPAEHRLAQEYGIGRDSVRAALTILRGEGLLITRAPYGTRVRQQPDRRPVRVPRGSSVVVKMPTPEERREHDLDEGVPMIVLTDPSGRMEVIAGDEVTLRFS